MAVTVQARSISPAPAAIPIAADSQMAAAVVTRVPTRAGR